MKTTEQITELLEDLSDNDLFNYWNDYQDEISGEQHVYEFEENFFTEYFSNPYEAARATYFGKIESWNNKYIMFNGFGNLESSNYLSDMISIYDLANHIEANQDDFVKLLAD